jgi:hypothetical protein
MASPAGSHDIVMHKGRLKDVLSRGWALSDHNGMNTVRLAGFARAACLP